MHTTFLSLVTSIGNKDKNLRLAIKHLDNFGEVERISSFHETAPEGGIAENMFLNACIKLETSLTPEKLLTACQEIEKTMGRVRNKKWEDRIIDIDIITYDNISLNSPNLIIPHPLAYKRDFVIDPLREIVDFYIEDKKIIIL